MLSPFKFPQEQARSKPRKSSSHEDIFAAERSPLYEIVKEPLIAGQPHLITTRLHLNTTSKKHRIKDYNDIESSEVWLSSDLQLLKIMASDGYWELDQQFANVISVSLTELKDSFPFIEQPINESDFFDKRENIYKRIWATTMALTWLRSTKKNLKDEWGLVEMKAKNWLSKQRLPEGCDLNDISLISQKILK